MALTMTLVERYSLEDVKGRLEKPQFPKFRSRSSFLSLFLFLSTSSSWYRFRSKNDLKMAITMTLI